MGFIGSNRKFCGYYCGHGYYCDPGKGLAAPNLRFRVTAQGFH